MNGLGTSWRSLQGYGLFIYGRSVSKTARFRIEAWDNLEKAKCKGRPVLWALWHGQLMPFVAFGDRYLDPSQFVAIMVGDERRDTLGTLASRLGGKTISVDMSGHPFAAGRAVLRVIREIQKGSHSVIAPDGPDGPAFVAKPGVAFLAQKANATILPVGAWTKHAIQLRRWDRYLLPLPFANVHVTIGAPFEVEAHEDKEELLRRISNSLHQVRARAQILAGVRPWR